MFVKRSIEEKINKFLMNFPAVAILGPRQCGKSTLARHLVKGRKDTIYLDLEKPSDRNKLSDPEIFFQFNKDKLICLDEIQRSPEIFSVMRSTIDENARNGQFLILGSASRELIRQSSESLAGRIIFTDLAPFSLSEIKSTREYSNGLLFEYWNRGGFPRSFLAKNDELSIAWRQSFINTFLERDILQLVPKISPNIIMRLWKMCAHSQGQILNTSTLGASLGITHTTVRKYLNLLKGTYMLRELPPYSANIKKRLIKSPKIYIRDTGILHALLNLETFDDILSHPVFGPSWETLVIENVLNKYSDWDSSFFRTSNGNEIDLILEKGNRKIAIECKAASAPKVSRGFYQAIKDIGISSAWVIAPVELTYPLKENVFVTSLNDFLERPL